MTAAAAVLLAAALTAGGVTLPGAAGAAGPADLVSGSTSTVQVAVPYPGHSTGFDVTARPTDATAATSLVLVVDGGTGPLADGPDALQLTLSDAAGAVLAEGTAAELGEATIDLGVLPAEGITVRGTATLPASATDAVQGVGLTLTLGLVATQESPPGAPPGAPPFQSGVLATTGGQVLALGLLAAALTATGVLLRAAHRRRAGVPRRAGS
ncbi:hypothetical protein MHY85_14945 [Cellulomonas sp. ACRRI]|uniref:hypothetical protein n=1 Tax=Cellulomonas sp. ACRRI TaxID=2918188 RepID=UPI001EF1C38C|nr:hypothetical protein [Cellulomonas sp. ACRRI]MCG7287261.1 hypothetical protein [Cellulomonas sp. ACRRI]